MQPFHLMAALLAAAAALPAFAQEAAPNTVVGKVETLYVRQSANFFIEKSLVRNSGNKEQWTEVRFAAALADGRKTAIIRLPDTATVERGDIVSAQLADKRDFVPGLIPEVNRMVALVAKQDTLAAMMFDIPKTDNTAAAQFVLPFTQLLQSSR